MFKDNRPCGRGLWHFDKIWRLPILVGFYISSLAKNTVYLLHTPYVLRFAWFCYFKPNVKLLDTVKLHMSPCFHGCQSLSASELIPLEPKPRK